VALLSRTELGERIERLCAEPRGSGSPGEARAARLIEEELRGLGFAVRGERERVHGTYWWPVGLPVAAAALAPSFGRLAGTLAGAAAAASVADDTSVGARPLRQLLADRSATNVIAELGARDAERTLLLVAHIDAAHSGLVFHPGVPRAILRRLPRSLFERSNTTPPTLWGAVAGPALVALGSALGARRLRRVGRVLSAGYALAMADIGSRDVVPGANDNATGVAALLSVAHWLAEDPPAGVRVLLLFTGSEESFMEGMEAFMRRHAAELPPDRTTVICLDTVGSPRLVGLEGEGFMRIQEYPKDLLDLAGDTAGKLGVELVRGLRLHNATDGLVALQRGYPTLMLGSVDEWKIPSNYHWPTDVPENVDLGTVEDAARLCRGLIERLAPSVEEQAQSLAAASISR
jgi:peptidase M28-like protein